MRLLTPDPDRFPLAAERFHWRWNRVFLLAIGGSATLALLGGILEALGASPPPTLARPLRSLLGIVGSASLLGGTILPVASWSAGRIRAGRKGVTTMLAAGAAGSGLVAASFGAAYLFIGSPTVEVVAGFLLLGGCTLAALAGLGGAGGRGRWPGFGSAIIGVVGLVGTGVIPGSGHVPETAYLAAVRSDLRNVASMQTVHFDSSGGYAGSLEALGVGASEGVRLTIERTPDGWTARGAHDGLDGAVCAVFAGSTPAAPAEREGEVACTVEPAEVRARSRERSQLRLAGSVLAVFLALSALGVRAVTTSEA